MPPKDPIIPIDRDFVVPPVLHAKIMIGNELFSRMQGINGKSPAFQQVIKEQRLDVNRHKTGLIYSRFNGNVIKRLYESTEVLATASEDEDYQRVIEVLRIFNTWSRLVSTTDTDLPDERIQEISCREAHSDDMKCCQTELLEKP
uniref:Uncharacterized protein n=1 Tax=Acrobeloides nanus TaxID=290746 RepID=A0A914DDB9_9BILA